MNRILKLAATLLAVLLACYAPSYQASAAPEPHGWLQVYSAQSWEPVGDEPRAYVHSAYKILSPEGKVVMSVVNAGRMLTSREPDVVKIRTGNYVVRGAAKQQGTVEVPVEIKRGQTVVLHLGANRSKDSAGK